MTNYPDIEKIGKISICCIITISDSSGIDELIQTGASRRYLEES